MDDDWIDASDDSVAWVTVQNLTDASYPEVERSLERIPSIVMEAEGGRQLGEVAIVLTTDSHLAELHEQHLGDGSFTDVMTFPYEDSSQVISGDIVISVDRALEQAEEERWSVENEIVFIAIHGMLHLCGWDDHTVADRERMHTRQREIMLLLNSETGSDAYRPM